MVTDEHTHGGPTVHVMDLVVALLIGGLARPKGWSLSGGTQRVLAGHKFVWFVQLVPRLLVFNHRIASMRFTKLSNGVCRTEKRGQLSAYLSATCAGGITLKPGEVTTRIYVKVITLWWLAN